MCLVDNDQCNIGRLLEARSGRREHHVIDESAKRWFVREPLFKVGKTVFGLIQQIIPMRDPQDTMGRWVVHTPLKQRIHTLDSRNSLSATRGNNQKISTCRVGL